MTVPTKVHAEIKTLDKMSKRGRNIMKELWAVKVISDCEGRTTYIKALFATEFEANRFADSDQGRDMYGDRGDVVPYKIVWYNTAEEAGASTWKRKNTDSAKKAAMAKLTAEERTLLGLE